MFSSLFHWVSYHIWKQMGCESALPFVCTHHFRLSPNHQMIQLEGTDCPRPTNASNQTSHIQCRCAKWNGQLVLTFLFSLTLSLDIIAIIIIIVGAESAKQSCVKCRIMWQKRKLFRAALIMSYTNKNRTEPRQRQNSHSVTSYDNDLDRSIEPQTAVDRRRQSVAASEACSAASDPCPPRRRWQVRRHVDSARACNKLLTHAARSEIWLEKKGRTDQRQQSQRDNN